MKRFLYLIAVLLISTYSLYGQKPTEEDPYLLWQTTDGYESFLVHPNGNIIAIKGNLQISELNGNTGEVIRVFKNAASVGDISPDGKFLLTLTDSVTILDYKTESVVKKLSVPGTFTKYFPDGNRIIYRYLNNGWSGLDSSIVVYDLIKDKYTYLDLKYSKPVIATSPDGKYFATGGTLRDKDAMGDDIYYTILNLWDAVTLKPIKQLDKIEGDNEVRSIKFSPDGKYVGFHVGWHDFHIYNLEDYNLVRLYNQLNVEFPPLTFSFLNSDLISFISLQLNEKDRFISIHSISNNILKYRYLGKTGFGTPAYSYLNFNSFNNSLVLNGGHLFAFDVNQMITTVEESPFKSTITVNYNKNSLILTDLNSISGQINITISDISGRVIRKLDSPTTNSELRIPLKLLNGTYLIHIQDGNQEYSSKFLVTE